MARPVAIATPSRPSHSPARAISTHNTEVTAGHGDAIASTGAKKNPKPTYHDDPARSKTITRRSHRGTGGAGVVFSGTHSACRRTAANAMPAAADYCHSWLSALPPRGVA